MLLYDPVGHKNEGVVLQCQEQSAGEGREVGEKEVGGRDRLEEVEDSPL